MFNDRPRFFGAQPRQDDVNMEKGEDEGAELQMEQWWAPGLTWPMAKLLNFLGLHI